MPTQATTPERFPDPDSWPLQRLRPFHAVKGDLPHLRMGTGRTRKLYDREYWHFRPTRFRGWDYEMPSEQLLTAEELKKKVDSRSTEDLLTQMRDVLGQLYFRAAAGDDEAMRALVERTTELARLLGILERYQPQKLRFFCRETSSLAHAHEPSQCPIQ